MKKRPIKLAALLLCLVAVFSCVPVSASAAAFHDVPEECWGFSYVDKLTKLGYVKGYGDGSFSPYSCITNAEFTALVCRMTGMNDTGLAEDGYWAEPLLEYAKYKGFFTDADMPKDAYDKPITRELAAKIVVLAFFGDMTFDKDLWKRYGMSDYSAVTEGLREYVLDAYSLGILKGYPDMSFQPKSSITRLEATALLCRAWELYYKEPQITGTVKVPILMYHQVTDKEGATTPEKFREDMTAIKDAGYTTVFYSELYDYVANKLPLPKKPVVVSFDDGYLDNYTNAYPILKELQMKAEISVIGGLVGAKQTAGVNAHFTWGNAREMLSSGLIQIESHTYKMHEYSPNGYVRRPGALRADGESWGAYLSVLGTDSNLVKTEFIKELGYSPRVFTYPSGYYSSISEGFFASEEYDVTVITAVGVNTLRQGDLSSLRLLKRFGVDGYAGNVAELINK